MINRPECAVDRLIYLQIPKNNQFNQIITKLNYLSGFFLEEAKNGKLANFDMMS